MTGCKARTPHRPTYFCTPSTKAKFKANHSHHICSGEKRWKVELKPYWLILLETLCETLLCEGQTATDHKGSAVYPNFVESVPNLKLRTNESRKTQSNILCRLENMNRTCLFCYSQKGGSTLHILFTFSEQ